MGCTMKHVYRGPVPDRPGRIMRKLDPHIDPCRACHCVARGQPVAAINLRCFNSCEIYGTPVTRNRCRGDLIFAVYPAYPRFQTGGCEHERIVDIDLAGMHRSRRDDTDSLQVEGPVNAHPEVAAGGSTGDSCGDPGQLFAQFIDATPGRRGRPDNRGTRHKRVFGKRLDFNSQIFETPVVHAIGFCDRQHTLLRFYQVHDAQVFYGLRHDAFVGRDNEQDSVDAGYAAQHVVNELTMARHINKPDARRVGIDISEARRDSQAAALFFFECVGVFSGQCLYQRCFSVVDMTGGRNDHPSCRVRFSS